MHPTFKFIFEPVRFHPVLSSLHFTQPNIPLTSCSFSWKVAASFSHIHWTETCFCFCCCCWFVFVFFIKTGFCQVWVQGERTRAHAWVSPCSLNGVSDSRGLQHRFDEPAIQAAVLMSQQVRPLGELLPSCIDGTGYRDLVASMQSLRRH